MFRPGDPPHIGQSSGPAADAAMRDKGPELSSTRLEARRRRFVEVPVITPRRIGD